MTTAESKRRKGKKKPISEQEKARREEQRRQEVLQARASAPPGFPIVIPFMEWCRLRGISKQTGVRLVRKGRVKVTQLSGPRLGIRSDHDREYLDSCARTA
jgi:hypothetical protein